jgi:hypothetical protein
MKKGYTFEIKYTNKKIDKKAIAEIMANAILKMVEEENKREKK